jgi:predicted phosphodiesterase
MKILTLSDTHFEFHRDFGRQFIADLDRNTDIVVLAGDIDNSRGLRRSLIAICEHFDGIPIIYVNGNHDFYYSNRESVLRTIEAVSNRCPNLRFLDNSEININGQRFLGTPLWFRDGPNNILHRSALNDFYLIQHYSTWVYIENKKAIDFLESNVGSDDIVITHHIPCEISVPAIYKNDTLTKFFLCEMHDLILDKEPKLWIHGHTHSASEYIFGNSTRIVCNPLGYPGEKTEYTDNLIIEV